MKTRPFFFDRLLLPAAALITFSGSVQAASQTWKAVATDGNWITATNWVGGGVPGITRTVNANNTDVVTFNAVSNFSTITVDANRFVNSIAFTAGAGAYTFTGGLLYLSQGGSISMAAGVTNAQIFSNNLQPQTASSTNGTLSFINNATSTAATLTFNAPTFTLTNGNGRPTTLTLDGSNTGENIISSNITDAFAAQAVNVINKNGVGTWVLSGSNTFTNSAGGGPRNVANGIQINAGTLVAANNNALGNNATANLEQVSINTGGTLQLRGGITLDNGISLNLNNGGTITSNGSNTTNARINVSTAASTSVTLATLNAADVFTIGNGANDLTGGAADSVIKISGPGTIFTAQASTNYLGGWSINAGTLKVGSSTSGLGVNGVVAFGSGSTGKLQLNAKNVTLTSLTTHATPGTAVIENGTAGASVLTVNNASANTFAGVIQDGAAGTLSLTKGAAGTLTLSGASSYTGGTTITAGTLVAGSSSALGSGAVSLTGATLSATNLTSGALTFGGTGNLALANVVANSVTSTGAITINGAGNLLTVGGSSVAGNTYTLLSGTSISGTDLSLTGTSVANQLILLGSNTTVGRTNYAFGSTSTALQLTVTGGAFNVTWNGGDAAWNAIDANWQKNGVGANIAFFTGDHVTISTANSIAVDGAGVSTGTLLVNNASGSATLTGGSVTANGAFTKSGAGTLQLDNALTATAGTTISAGTLALGATGSLSSSAVAVTGGALNIGATNATLANVSLTAGSINGSTGVLTGTGSAYDMQAGSVSAILGGGIGLNKTTGGTVTLAGANTYSGPTAISAGMLAISGSGTFGTGSLTVSGGIADLGGASITNTLGALSGGGAVNNGTITNNAGNYNLQDGSVGAVLAGTHGLNKSTAGTVALGGANTFSGATAITAGILRMDNSLALQNSTVTVSTTNGLAFGTAITSATVGSLSGGANLDLTNSDTNGVSLATGGNNASTTFSGILSGTGGSVTKNGTGALTLSGTNTYTGGTFLNAGTVIINNGSALGSGTLTASNGTTISLTTASGIGNAITLSGANATVTMTSNQTSSGYGSNLSGTADQTLQISGNPVNFNNTTRQFTNFLGTVNVLAGSTLGDRSSTTTWVNGGDNTLFNVDGFMTSRNGGNWALGALSGTGTLSMGGSGSNGIGLSYTLGARGTNTTFSGIIQDGDTANGKLVSVIKTGAATQTLSGASTFTGSLTVNGGTLAAALSSNSTNPVSGALGNTQVARNITVNTTGTLRFDAGDVMGGAGSSILSTLVINNGGTVTNNGTAFNTLGAVTLNGGTLTGTGGSSNGQFQMFAFGGTVTAGGSSASTISSAAGTTNGGTAIDTVGYHLGTGVATGTTFNVADATGSSASDLNVSASLIDRTGGLGAASLTKSGVGTMTLSGTNTYTGATTINAGILAVNGSITSSVTVNSGGTLSGSGTITGDLAVASNGILAAGNSPGVLTASGTTTLASGSIFSWDLDTTLSGRGTAYDGVNTTAVSGSGAIFQVVLQGAQSFGDAFWTSAHTWSDIFTTDGTTPVSSDLAAVFSTFTYANGSGVLGTPSAIGSFSLTGSSLSWSAVPEPTSALAGLLLGAGLLRRRRAGVTQ